MSRIPIIGYTTHYNTKKQRNADNSWRLGASLVATPKVGINLDLMFRYHIWAFWWNPTGYGSRWWR